MSEDKRDVLEVLRELNFVEQGGYGNWYSTPWTGLNFSGPQSCLNHGDRRAACLPRVPAVRLCA